MPRCTGGDPRRRVRRRGKVPSARRARLASGAALRHTALARSSTADLPMKPSTLLATLALALAAAPASAAFRCTDKAGKTVYMERTCNTYGYTMAKEIKDPPKGDGSARVLKSGQALIGSPSERSGNRDPKLMVPLQCDTERVMCQRGDTVMCGGKKHRCDSD